MKILENVYPSQRAKQSPQYLKAFQDELGDDVSEWKVLYYTWIVSAFGRAAELKDLVSTKRLIYDVTKPCVSLKKIDFLKIALLRNNWHT